MIENYRRRKLDPTKGYKPLDFGGGGITGSINRDGRITAINTYHPEHGYVTLTSAPPFDETQRYNPSAVRAYRKSLVNLEGYGLKFFDVPIVSYEAWLIEDAIPHLKLILETGEIAEVTIFITHYTTYGVAYLWNFSELKPLAHNTGKIWLQRCAYTQLTEGGPLLMPSVETKIIFERTFGVSALENKALGIYAFLFGYLGKECEDGSIEFTTNETFPFTDELAIKLGLKEVPFTFGLDLTQNNAFWRAELVREYGADNLLHKELDKWQKRWDGWQYENHPLDLPLRRALVYALHCCIPNDENSICIITDHQLLPLSWTRDAYYTIMPLLRWKPEFHELVKKHLNWLFEKAERPDGHWGRAYLANGRVKDKSFQLDQQLYPLLELAEYVETTGDTATWERFQLEVEKVLEMLLEKGGLQARQLFPENQDPYAAPLEPAPTSDFLFPTEETPADDPVSMPYHLSSHILFWHTLQKLSPLMNGKWDKLAESIREAVYQYFVAAHNPTPQPLPVNGEGSKNIPPPTEKIAASNFPSGEGEKIFAYLTNGKGQHHFYHDANDLPLALAPIWGFCMADDPIWLATMNFAFSEANKGGFYGSPQDEFRGLGSVHTPSAWPLGDVQEILFAQLIGDETRKNHVIEKLAKVAQWDGGLPEAYDVKTGEVVSRHWFAWSNAALHLCKWD